MCMVFMQISHTFFDAPGALAATFVDTEGEAITQDKPYVTMVFCGPADYKASALHVLLACQKSCLLLPLLVGKTYVLSSQT